MILSHLRHGLKPKFALRSVARQNRIFTPFSIRNFSKKEEEAAQEMPIEEQAAQAEPLSPKEKFERLMQRKRSEGYAKAAAKMTMEQDGMPEDEIEEKMKEFSGMLNKEEGEEEDVVGYHPPRPLQFNIKGEMQLFDLSSSIRRSRRTRQLPALISTGFFTYLITSNLNVFSFDTATIGTYFKLSAYFFLGFCPSVFFINLMRKITRLSISQMMLKHNGSQVKFLTSGGDVFTSNISDIQPIMNDGMMMALQNPKISHVHFQFYTNGSLYMIERLPKTNANLDIVQSVIHGIHIIVEDPELTFAQRKPANSEQPNQETSEENENQDKEKS